jgi:hypothetical protein
MNSLLAFLFMLCGNKNAQCEKKVVECYRENYSSTKSETEMLSLVLTCKKCGVVKPISIDGNIVDECNVFKRSHWDCGEEDDF